MEEEYTLHFVETEEDIKLFWQWRDDYDFENSNPSSDVTEETEHFMEGMEINIREEVLSNDKYNPKGNRKYKYFFSKEYKNNIMELFYRKTQALRIVFLQKNGINVGFAVYVIYNLEDGKCFILDFCVKKEYRNKGTGTLFFSLFCKYVKGEGAKYIAINTSNENNRRFWKRNGFIEGSKDEYGVVIYEYKGL